MRVRRWIDLAALVALAIPVTAIAQETKAEPAKTTPPAQISKGTAMATLDKKQAEMAELKGKAADVTKGLAELAASGKLTTSQEAVQAMREMVEALQGIQEQLDKIHQEIEGIKGWIEGQNEALPIMANDILDLKRHKWGNYIQMQYRDTDQVGGATDGFALRRVRLGITQTIDPRTTLRASFDLATSTTNNVAQLRDAFVKWDLEPSFEKIGTELQFGQFPLALGYELERSSSERELPERATYNRVVFAGERSRGVQVKHGLSEKSHVVLGAFNALSYDDPEQRSIAPAPENKLAGLAAFRYYDTQYDFGFGYFRGERPKVTTTRTANNVTTTYNHPQVSREIFYLDGTIVGILDPKLYARFEVMQGKDRVPITPGANNSVSSVRGQVDINGQQVQIGYNIDARNQMNVRWDAWDPDADIDGNVVTTWGAAYSYFINPGARITLSREWIDDPSRAGINDKKYVITTLRAVFRF